MYQTWSKKMRAAICKTNCHSGLNISRSRKVMTQTVPYTNGQFLKNNKVMYRLLRIASKLSLVFFNVTGI